MVILTLIIIIILSNYLVGMAEQFIVFVRLLFSSNLTHILQHIYQ